VPWIPWPERTGMTVSSGALSDEHASKAWLTYSACVSPGA
jgi:hypothetical protein